MLSRLSAVVKTKMNKILDDAEDPYETLAYAREKLRETIRDAERGTAELAAHQRDLQHQASRLNRTTPQLYIEALDAIAAADEDAARSALTRQQATWLILQELRARIADLEQRRQALIAEIPAMQDSLASLQHDIKEIPKDSKLDISPEEKTRIRSIINDALRPSERLEHSLHQFTSVSRITSVPAVPDTITDENATQLIELFAPLAASRQIEEELYYLQELQPATEAVSLSADTFSRHR